MTLDRILDIVQAAMQQLSPADRAALAAAASIVAALLVIRVIVGYVGYSRRHGWHSRLRRIRRRYVLEVGEPGEDKPEKRRIPAERGLLTRAQVPRSWPGRQRHKAMNRIVAAGGRGALPWLLVPSSTGALGTLLLITPIAGILVGMATAVAIWAGIAEAGLRVREARAQKTFLDQFPEALDMIVRAVRAGLPVGHAINAAADELTGPVALEFGRIRDELALGINFDTALANAGNRIRIKDFRFFVVTLALQQETGGRLTETLENLSDIVRRRSDMRAKVRALTADGRTSALVIGALPVVTAGGLMLINPGYLTNFMQTDAGQIMMAVAVGLVVTGFIVIQRMVKIGS